MPLSHRRQSLTILLESNWFPFWLGKDLSCIQSNCWRLSARSYLLWMNKKVQWIRLLGIKQQIENYAFRWTVSSLARGFISMYQVLDRPTDAQTWFLTCGSSGWISRSSLWVMVIGQGHHIPGQKTFFNGIPMGYLLKLKQLRWSNLKRKRARNISEEDDARCFQSICVFVFSIFYILRVPSIEPITPIPLVLINLTKTNL